MENSTGPKVPSSESWGPRPATERSGPTLSRARTLVLETLLNRAEPTSIAALVGATGLHPNTVREHLEALERRRLVARHKASAHGRGRPAWLYSALGGPPPARSEYAGLAATLAAAITRGSDHPEEDAIASGSEWGHQLARDHGRPVTKGADSGRREVLAVLDELGFAPEGANDRPVVRLTRCPLLEAAHKYPDVVCGVHLGIVRGALEEYDVDPAGTELTPFAEPGACRLRLASA
ncbi:MAG: helix-turn-helix transcriptional regulator [Nocardioidaceae bacterium]